MDAEEMKKLSDEHKKMTKGQLVVKYIDIVEDSIRISAKRGFYHAYVNIDPNCMTEVKEYFEKKGFKVSKHKNFSTYFHQNNPPEDLKISWQ
jgi:hypothetical protein